MLGIPYRYTIKEHGKYGLIDEEGRVVVEPRFEFLGQCSDGFICMRSGDRFGFIDLVGNVALAPTFISTRSSGPSFHEGLAVVGTPGEKQYIDKSGGIRIVGNFESATDFSHNYAAVTRVGTHADAHVIDKTGETVGQLPVAEVPETPG